MIMRLFMEMFDVKEFINKGMLKERVKVMTVNLK